MTDLESARREAIRVLCQAHAEDRLPVEAFESRLDRLKQAPNESTVAAIVADLEPHLPIPVTTGTRALAVPEPADLAAPVYPAEFLRIASVFGTTTRAGSWTVPLVLQARVLLGEMTIDLRDAVFGSDVVDIEADVRLGSFTLIVPAGTQVENEIEETLSASSHSTRSARGARPNGLLVRLRGRAILASIEIKEKFPSSPSVGKTLFDRLLGSGG
jgi:hypothetical protein